MKKNIFVYLQMLYFLAYVLLGTGMYFLAKGMNMDMPFSNMSAIIATLSVSGISGYLAFFSLGGLGVREGMMYVLLKQFSGVRTALILPIAIRLLCIMVDLMLGIAGLFVGMNMAISPERRKADKGNDGKNKKLRD